MSTNSQIKEAAIAVIAMYLLIILLAALTSGCVTAKNKNAEFQAWGSVKGLVVAADGTITAQEVTSPAEAGLTLLQQGMIGKALGVLR